MPGRPPTGPRPRPGLPGGRPPAAGPFGAAPPPPPVAVAIGVTNVTQTSATLVGSINTQGLPGSWWLVWGTLPSSLSSLVTNPSFENDALGGTAAGWTTTSVSGNCINNGATATVVSTQAEVGSQSLQVTTTNALAAEGVSTQVLQGGTYFTGQTYTGLVWLRGNAGGETVQVLLGNTASAAHTSVTNVTLTQGWQLVTVSWTVAATDGNFPISFAIRTQSAAAATFFVDGAVVSGGLPSPIMSASASTIPITVQGDPTNLVTGVTYYFVVVVQTASGTATSFPVSFKSLAPPTPVTIATAVPSSLPSSLTIPHFSWPFTMKTGTAHVGTGNVIISHDGARVVQQDSDGDVMACVSAVVFCTVGQCPEYPAFGIPDLAFSQVPIDTQGLSSTVTRWEPRATEQIFSSMVADGTEGTWQVNVNTLIQRS